MRISDWSSDVGSSDLLEHGTNDLRALAAPGQAEQGAAGAVVPAGCAEPEQRGDVDHALARLAQAGHVVALGGAGDDPEVVAEPLHVGAGGEHHGLGAPHDSPAGLPGHDREAPAVALVRKAGRSEEHTSELQSLMRITYAGF